MQMVYKLGTTSSITVLLIVEGVSRDTTSHDLAQVIRPTITVRRRSKGLTLREFSPKTSRTGPGASATGGRWRTRFLVLCSIGPVNVMTVVAAP